MDRPAETGGVDRTEAHAAVEAYLLAFPNPPDPPANIENWIDGLRWRTSLNLRPSASPAGRRFIESSVARRRDVLVAAATQLFDAEARGADWLVLDILFYLAQELGRDDDLRLDASAAAGLAEAVAETPATRYPRHLLKTLLERTDDAVVGDEAVQAALARVARRSWGDSSSANEAVCKTVWERLDRPLRLRPDDLWAHRILRANQALDADARDRLRDLVEHAATARPQPSQRWKKEMRCHLDASAEPYADRFRGWMRGYSGQREHVLRGSNANVLRGLVWAAALVETPPVGALVEVALACYSRAVSYVHEMDGPIWEVRNEAVGNVAVRALASVGTVEARESIWALRQTAPTRRARSLIDRLFTDSYP